MQRRRVDTLARLVRALSLLLVLSTPARKAASSSREEESGWRPQIYHADDKILFDWKDKAQLSLGGLFQFDSGYIEKDAVVTPEGWNAEVRRARFNLDGLFVGRYFFRIEYDVSGNSGRANELQADYKDVYVGIRDIPYLGTFRAGHLKEPYSLQHLIYAGDRTFMEESLLAAFTPGRNTGIMFNNALFNERVTWAFGAFSNVTKSSKFFGNKGQYNLTLRITTLPWYKEGGRKLFHIGAAYTHQFRNHDDDVAYSTRPEFNMADVIGDTGAIRSESQDSVGSELAVNYGPLSAQLETSVPWLNTPGRAAHHFKSAYVQLGYFLTGEHRPYDPENGVFDRLRPNRPISEGGWGAWEVALRATYLDLHDKEIRGGYMNQLGAALNWYLLSSARLNIEYLHNHRNNYGNSNLFQMRLQFEF